MVRGDTCVMQTTIDFPLSFRMPAGRDIVEEVNVVLAFLRDCISLGGPGVRTPLLEHVAPCWRESGTVSSIQGLKRSSDSATHDEGHSARALSTIPLSRLELNIILPSSRPRSTVISASRFLRPNSASTLGVGLRLDCPSRERPALRCAVCKERMSVADGDITAAP